MPNCIHQRLHWYGIIESTLQYFCPFGIQPNLSRTVFEVFINMYKFSRVYSNQLHHRFKWRFQSQIWPSFFYNQNINQQVNCRILHRRNQLWFSKPCWRSWRYTWIDCWIVFLIHLRLGNDSFQVIFQETMNLKLTIFESFDLGRINQALWILLLNICYINTGDFFFNAVHSLNSLQNKKAPISN